MFETMDADDDLLGSLVSRGLVPSFSFPLHVCEFEVSGSEDGEDNIEARTSQDMQVALNQFVPGSLITINKKTYLSEGLLVKDRPEEWQYRVNRTAELFEEERWEDHIHCTNCESIFRLSGDTEIETGTQCPICRSSDESDSGTIRKDRYIWPDGFSAVVVPHYFGQPQPNKEGNLSATMKARDNPRQFSGARVRSRARLPTPRITLEEKEVGGDEDSREFWSGSKHGFSNLDGRYYQKNLETGEGVELVMVNMGPMNQGWPICKNCGRVALSNKTKTKSSGHHRPYALPWSNSRGLSEEDKESWQAAASRCPPNNFDDGLGFGFTFRSDLVFLRLKLKSPLALDKRVSTPMKGALSAIKEAFVTEATKCLDLVDREIESGYRHITLPNSEDKEKRDQFVDLYFFDSVSGGAGLVDDLRNIPGVMEEILNRVEKRLEGKRCIDSKPCPRACIGCLLDFRNAAEHRIIDRVLGLQLFQYMKSGTAPDPDCPKPDTGETQRQKIIARIASLIEDVKIKEKHFNQGGHDLDLMECEYNGESLVAHFHSVLSDPAAEGVFETEKQFRIGKTGPIPEDKILMIPYELAQANPGVVIGWIEKYLGLGDASGSSNTQSGLPSYWR